MPQLEQIATYLSQTFWLVVTFGLLYLILWRAALPRVGDVLRERQERIDGDIERTEKLKEEAEAVLEAYEATVAEARTEAQSVLRETAAEIAKQADARHAALTEKIVKDTATAEERIQAARQEAISNIRAVSAEVAQAAAARLVGGNVSHADADAAVAAALKARS